MAGRNAELILLVEDQDNVRMFIGEVLRAHRYRVLEASSLEAAIRVVEESTEPIRLLLTDVVMPGMNGFVLAARLRQLMAGIKTLYVSGYAENVVVHRDTSDLPDVHFLHKPFSPDVLSAKIQEILAD